MGEQATERTSPGESVQDYKPGGSSRSNDGIPPTMNGGTGDRENIAWRERPECNSGRSGIQYFYCFNIWFVKDLDIWI